MQIQHSSILKWKAWHLDWVWFGFRYPVGLEDLVFTPNTYRIKLKCTSPKLYFKLFTVPAQRASSIQYFLILGCAITLRIFPHHFIKHYKVAFHKWSLLDEWNLLPDWKHDRPLFIQTEHTFKNKANKKGLHSWMEYEWRQCFDKAVTCWCIA